MRWLLIILWLVTASAAHGRSLVRYIPQVSRSAPDPGITGFFVATNGSHTAAGSISDPWSIQKGLTNTASTSTDNIWMREGTYRGAWAPTFKGVLRSYPGELAVLDSWDKAQLHATITSGSSSITVSQPVNWRSASTVLVGREIMQVSSVGTGNTNFNVNRGWSGTTAAAHTAGETIGIVDTPLFTITTTNVHLRDLVMRNSNTNRSDFFLDLGDGYLEAIPRGGGVRWESAAADSSVVNCWMDSFYVNFSSTAQPRNIYLYGNVVVRYGAQEAAHIPTAYAFYMQNTNNIPHTNDNNMVIQGHSYGTHHYGEDGGLHGGFEHHNTIIQYTGANATNYASVADSPIFTGSGDQRLDKMKFIRLFVVGFSNVITSGARIGYVNTNNGSLLIEDSYFRGHSPPVDVTKFTNLLSFARNRLVGYKNDRILRMPGKWYNYPTNFDNNFYHWLDSSSTPFTIDGGGNHTFANWKTNAFGNGYRPDTNSTFATTAPATNPFIVTTNLFEPKRYHFAVDNHQGLDNVEFDPTGRFTSGETIYIMDPYQSQLGALIVSNWVAGTISIPLTNRNWAKPLGEGHTPMNEGKAAGAWIITTNATFLPAR